MLGDFSGPDRPTGDASVNLVSRCTPGSCLVHRHTSRGCQVTTANCRRRQGDAEIPAAPALSSRMTGIAGFAPEAPRKNADPEPTS